MKLTCSMKDFARFIRECERITAGTGCANCVMVDVCGEDRPEDAIEIELVEDE